MEAKRCGKAQGLNFNLKVTGFTDICTVNRLAISHCFSETTLSLHSVPETYSSRCICHRMKPFLETGRKEEKRNTEKHSELNELNSGDACLTIFNPVWSSRFPLVYCTHSHWSINQGGGIGGLKKWHVTSESFELSTCHLQRIQTLCHPFVFPP